MDWMIWAMLLQQQAQEREAARQRAEAQARAEAEAQAQAARDAETKRQAQIAQQRQADVAAAQKAEQDRQAAAAALPGPADPYGEYRASINLDNSATQNSSRNVGTASNSMGGNPLGGFASAPKPSSLAGLFSSAVAPKRPQATSDFGQSKSSGNVVGGSQPVSGGTRISMF